MTGSRGMLRVLVADDSPAAREVIRHYLECTQRIEVVGEAADGVEAVEKAAALRPDVMTLDIAMPRLDGLGAIAAIMEQSPTRIIVVADTTRQQQTDLSFRATTLGALYLLPKAIVGECSETWGQRLAQTVRLMADVPVVRRYGRRDAAACEESRIGHASVFGIVASCGGPGALEELLSALPRTFPAPVLVAQHLAPGFCEGLTRWLDKATPLTVSVARRWHRCLPGHVYVAPEGNDLTMLADGTLALQPSSSAAGTCGDRMLQSLAEACGRRAAGIVLSGMGSDGARGLLAIRRAGGPTMAQEESSCAVSAMPAAAAACAATDTFLPPTQLAKRMLMIAREPRKGGSA